MKQLLFVALIIFGMTITHSSAEQALPWSVPPEGLNFTIPGIDMISDLNGDIVDPDLVIFAGGNQFMVFPHLVAAFKKEFPQYKRIYWETLPPGIIAEQMKTGTLVIGNLQIKIQPDVFTAGKKRIEELKDAGLLENPVDYTSNTLGIMVRKGNPKGIKSLADLADSNITVAMPGVKEGIRTRIIKALDKAGGSELAKKVTEEKHKAGTTFNTRIHHRETPLRVMESKSDAGPVWITEALFQKKIGNPIDLVKIPANHNVNSVSSSAVVKKAAHKEAADHFVKFLAGEKSQKIFKEFGFSEPNEK